MSAVLDTRAALWYLANSKELSSVARTTPLWMPPIANALENIPRIIVPDMPDRIIAATAAFPS
jgi:hypothetical protein